MAARQATQHEDKQAPARWGADDDDESSRRTLASEASGDSSSFVLVLGASFGSAKRDGGDGADSSVASLSGWSVVDEFSTGLSLQSDQEDFAVVVRKKDKHDAISPLRSSRPMLPPHRRTVVLTERLHGYLSECVREMSRLGADEGGNPNTTTVPKELTVRLLPKRDLEARLALFLRAATFGIHDDDDCDEHGIVLPRIEVGYKCTPSSEAAWDGIRWAGFRDDGNVKRGRRGHGGENVGVARDLGLAYGDYLSLHALQHQLDTIVERKSSRRVSYHRMIRQPRFEGNETESTLEPPQSSTKPIFWMVATAEVVDPFQGNFPEVPTRYAPICNDDGFFSHGGRVRVARGLVRLFESRDQVLPLFCFVNDTNQEREMLQQIEQGVSSIFSTFFEQLVAPTI